jgi:hypothetical protein
VRLKNGQCCFSFSIHRLSALVHSMCTAFLYKVASIFSYSLFFVQPAAKPDMAGFCGDCPQPLHRAVPRYGEKLSGRVR